MLSLDATHHVRKRQPIYLIQHRSQPRARVLSACNFLTNHGNVPVFGVTVLQRLQISGMSCRQACRIW